MIFFAEIETLWSQGPVTQDFWNSYSIRLRYSPFWTFSRMLSQRWNPFRVWSASDKICSSYAQCVMKFVPRMLSMDTCKNCSHFTAGWACAKICSLYDQCAMKPWNPSLQHLKSRTIFNPAKPMDPESTTTIFPSPFLHRCCSWIRDG